jgi:protein SCO1
VATSRQGRRSRTARSSRRFVVLFGIVAAVLLAAYAAPLLWPPKADAHEAGLGGLVDHDGKTLDAHALSDRYKLIFFGFTQCAAICPATLVKMHSVLGELGADGNDLTPLFVSVDPQHDTPAVLKTYTTAFDPRILGITGDPSRIEALVSAYGALAIHHAGQVGAMSVDHTTRLYLVAPDNSLLAYYEIVQPPQQIAADIARRIRG